MFLHTNAKDRLGLAILGVLILAIAVTLGYKAQRGEPHIVSAMSASRVAAALPVQPSEAVVHIVGAVAKPGVYRLKGDSRTVDAIQAAGGFGADADREAINLASRISDGEQIRVPRKGETAAVPATGKAGKIQSGTVSLNSASIEELEQLPGVGPATAQKIIDYRTSHGGFKSIDQLREVGGIGDKKLARLSPHVRL